MKERTYIAIDLKNYGISGRGRLFEVTQNGTKILMDDILNVEGEIFASLR